MRSALLEAHAIFPGNMCMLVGAYAHVKFLPCLPAQGSKGSAQKKTCCPWPGPTAGAYLHKEASEQCLGSHFPAGGLLWPYLYAPELVCISATYLDQGKQ